MSYFKLVSERRGDHVHERVFVGPDSEHLALAGTLVMSVGEWQTFGAALRVGTSNMPAYACTVEFIGDNKVVGA